MKRIGRRRGNSGTRETILEAARRLFGERGFDAATVRAIAAAAEVDPALVHHYFGTKEQLFQAAMKFPIDPRELVAEVIEGGRDEIGERLVRTFVRVWDSPVGTAGVGLMRSAMSNDRTLRLMREFLTTQVLRRVMAVLEAPAEQAPLRGSLIASQMAGLAMVRYILKVEPLASLPADQVVRAIAPTIQRYATGPLD